MNAYTFSRLFASSSSPLFAALRQLATSPRSATFDGAGWPVWTTYEGGSGVDPRDAATLIDPDGSPA